MLIARQGGLASISRSGKATIGAPTKRTSGANRSERVSTKYSPYHLGLPGPSRFLKSPPSLGLPTQCLGIVTTNLGEPRVPKFRASLSRPFVFGAARVGELGRGGNGHKRGRVHAFLLGSPLAQGGGRCGAYLTRVRIFTTSALSA